MKSQQKFVTFELIFHGLEPDLNNFSKNFDDVEWVLRHVKRQEPQMAYAGGGVPAELIVLVVSVAANILTIADILAKRLTSRNDSTIRVGKKEIRLKGEWKTKEIASILNAISMEASKREALEQIEKIRTARIAQAEAKLVELEGSINKYEELVRTFSDIPEKKKWQKKRAEEYKRRLDELHKEADDFRDLINFLHQKGFG